MVAEEVAGGSDEVYLQFRAEKLDKKVSLRILLVILNTLYIKLYLPYRGFVMS